MQQHAVQIAVQEKAVQKRHAQKRRATASGAAPSTLAGCTHPCAQGAQAGGRGQAAEGHEGVDVARHLLGVEGLPQHPGPRGLPLARLLLGVRQEVAELEGAAEQEVEGLHLREAREAACKY